MIGDLAAFGEDGGDEQVFRPGVGRALIDEQFLVAAAGGGHAEGGLADSGRADDAGGQGQVAFVDHQPAGEQLLEDFALANPLSGGGFRGTEGQPHSVNFYRFGHGWIADRLNSGKFVRRFRRIVTGRGGLRSPRTDNSYRLRFVGRGGVPAGESSRFPLRG